MCVHRLEANPRTIDPPGPQQPARSLPIWAPMKRSIEKKEHNDRTAQASILVLGPGPK
jgi:hypothetical protein